MRRAFLLTAIGLGLWLALLLPAWLWYGHLALVQSATALILSLLPAVVTMLWADIVWRRSPDLQVLAALGGSGVRLAITLGVGAFLYFNYPDTFTPAFWGWVLLFYSVLLAAEVALLLRPGTTGQ
jgi:hypothetical protein